MLSPAIEAVLDSNGAAAGAVARHVREVVLESDPTLAERALPGWGAISFHHPKAGFLCAVFPHPDRVDLAFERGAELSDPRHLLVADKTSSKRVRYARFPLDRLPDADAIDFFVQQAVEVGRR